MAISARILTLAELMMAAGEIYRDASPIQRLAVGNRMADEVGRMAERMLASARVNSGTSCLNWAVEK